MLDEKVFTNNQAPDLDAKDLNVMFGEINQAGKTSGQDLSVPVNEHPTEDETKMLARAMAHYSATSTFYTAIHEESTDTYVLTSTDNFVTPDKYLNGMLIRFCAPSQNITSQTKVSVNGLPSKIIKESTVPLAEGAITALQEVSLRYDAKADRFINISGKGPNGGGANLPLFFMQPFPFKITDASWGEFGSTQDGTVCVSAYNELLKEFHNSVGQGCDLFWNNPPAGIINKQNSEVALKEMLLNREELPIYELKGTGNEVRYYTTAAGTVGQTLSEVLADGTSVSVYREETGERITVKKPLGASSYYTFTGVVISDLLYIRYFRGPTGKKLIVTLSAEDESFFQADLARLDNIWELTGSAFYFVLDTVNKRIILPRSDNFIRFGANIETVGNHEDDKIKKFPPINSGTMFIVSNSLDPEWIDKGTGFKNGTGGGSDVYGRNVELDLNKRINTGEETAPRNNRMIGYFYLGGISSSVSIVDITKQITDTGEEVKDSIKSMSAGIQVMTAQEYFALPEKDAGTFYFIVEQEQ